MESREDAIRILTEQRAETLALLDRLSPRARTRPGLGGGAWSPKDLLGHLESWEEHAIHALEAWARNERAPIDVALAHEGLTWVNRREVERKAKLSYPTIAASAARTHARLLDAIGSMTDQRWHAPATSRARRPIGHRLGQLLVGAGPFGHDRAHLPSLRALVQDGRRSIP